MTRISISLKLGSTIINYPRPDVVELKFLFYPSRSLSLHPNLHHSFSNMADPSLTYRVFASIGMTYVAVKVFNYFVLLLELFVLHGKDVSLLPTRILH